MPARILVVEDNSLNLKLMTYLLKARGHETWTAGDGIEALRLLQATTFDIVVCDVQLPVMDGFEVARWMKCDSSLARIPLLAVTALAMVGDRDRILKAGFDAYLAKPIVPREFAREVEALIAGPPAAARDKVRSV